MHKRAMIIVLDSAGIGALPDAEQFGDTGSNTIGNIYHHRGKQEHSHTEKSSVEIMQCTPQTVAANKGYENIFLLYFDT